MAELPGESCDQCFEIEDYLHEQAEEVRNDQVYFNVVIFGGKGVGKKALREFKPLFQKNGLQMNAIIKVELKHSIMMSVEIPDKRPTGYDISKEGSLKIQLTFIDVEDGHQVVKEKVEGHMYLNLFDLTTKSSLEALEKLAVLNPSVPAILIGNKVDLVEKRVVGQEDIDNLCKKLNCSHYGEISALTGKGVMEEVWLQIMRVRKDWMHKRIGALIQENKERREREKRESAEIRRDLIANYPHVLEPEACNQSCRCIERFESRRRSEQEGSKRESSHDQGEGSHEQGESSKEQGESSHEQGESSKEQDESSHEQGESSHEQGEISHEQDESSREQDKTGHEQGESSREQVESSREQDESSH